MPTSAAKLLFERKGRPIGLSLYTIDALYRSDLNAALEAVAEIGFREVEGSLGTHPIELMKPALTRSGLRCSSLSVLPTPLRGGPSLETDAGVLASAIHSVGAEYLSCTLFPLPAGVEMHPLNGESIQQMMVRVARSVSADHWKRTADVLNDKGAQLQRHGVKFAYHNHNPELAPQGETNGLAILLEHTDPALVHFQMDAGWVVAAGHDPVEILRAYPGRFRLMHVKDVATGNQTNTSLQVMTTEVGSGIIDWKRVIHAGLSAGIQHFAIEQEPPFTLAPLEAARKGFTYLSGLEL
jgi:sugar phosphate isomerase/epimerase